MSHRRYGDGIVQAREALTLDSSSVRALGMLGTNELRTGRDGAGSREPRARVRDRSVQCVAQEHARPARQAQEVQDDRDGRFRIVAPPEESELLAAYLVPLLDEAYDSLAARYRFTPQGPVRLELYRSTPISRCARWASPASARWA